MFCSNCGNQIPNNVKFCANCGTKQTNEEVDSKSGTKTPIKQNLNKDAIISTLSLHLNERSSKTLKILSAISVIIFFLPIGSGWGLFCNSLSSMEHSAVAVPLFVFLVTLFIIIFFKLTTNRTVYKLGAILSGINILLSLNLALPTPYNTQYLCIGSILVLLVSVAMSICSVNAFRSFKKTEAPEYCDTSKYKEKEKEVSDYVNKQKLILKTFALIGMIIFFFPVAVTSCQNNIKRETGLDIMNHFSSGIGNMYAIIIFGLFLLVFVTLFFQNKIFTTFSFVFGSVNVILLAMSKAVFGSYISNYLLGFYLCCVTTLVLSIGGYIYYTKVRKAWGDDFFSSLKTNSKSMFIATVITVISLIVVVVANYNINNKSVDVPNISNSSNTKPTTSTPTLKYTFNEVVTKQPNYFIDGGKDFQVKSQEANYYGEITVGKRSYVEGMSDTTGTYALFVTDGSNAKITFKFNLEGYYKTHALKGTANSNNIVYPADASFLAVGMTKNTMSYTGKGGGTFEDINGLRLVEAYFSKNDNLTGSNFHMLTVVISKDEAVRYAQDGTLPNCLKGLTVTGLDKIFKKP